MVSKRSPSVRKASAGTVCGANERHFAGGIQLEHGTPNTTVHTTSHTVYVWVWVWVWVCDG
jgi:hypothetical protein